MSSPATLLLFLLLPLAAACSGEKRSDPGTPIAVLTPPAGIATPVVTPSASGMPVTAASLGLETTPVRWVSANVVEAFPIAESAEPFANDPRISQRPAGGPPVRWSIQVVEGDAAPRQVYASPRWLESVKWTPDNKLVGKFRTRREVQIPTLGGRQSLPWYGFYSIDIATGRNTDEWAAIPSDEQPILRSPVMPDDQRRTITTQFNLRGDSTLVTISKGSGPFAQIEEVYIIQAPGISTKLEGLTGLRHINWLPSGGMLQAFKASGAPTPNAPFMPTNDAYLIPVKDGNAMFIGSRPLGIEGNAAGTPDIIGTRALLLLPDTNAGPNATKIVLIDTVSYQMSVVGSGPPFAANNPAGFPNQVPMLWPARTDRVLFGVEPDTQIIDVKTGARTPGRYQDIFPNPPATEPASPNGRYLVKLAEPKGGPPAQDCRGKPFKLEVTDKQTNQTKEVMSCPTGTSGGVYWITDTKFILSVASCWQCESDTAQTYIVDAAKGEAISLTQGLEASATTMPSPDATRLLMSGPRLRIFDLDGKLLRDLGPPPAGYSVHALTWSPDGKSFAFLLGPAGWSYGGP